MNNEFNDKNLNEENLDQEKLNKENFTKEFFSEAAQDSPKSEVILEVDESLTFEPSKTISNEMINQYEPVQSEINEEAHNEGIFWVPENQDNDFNEKPKKKHSFRFAVKLTASALAFGLIAGITFQGYNSITYNNNNNSAIVQTSSKTEVSSNNDSVVTKAVSTILDNSSGDGVSNIVENVMPAIVSINAIISDSVTDMFGRKFESESEGSGSGIIVGKSDTEILIVTNNHVVADSKNLEVTFNDETIAQATIKGTDVNSDLAVIAIQISNLSDSTLANIKIATLGDSNSLKTGEMAIAIGNALGYGQSVTVGVISALNREVTVDNLTMKLLQTDAAINPGNSGGALLNANGEVVGINSVKYASAGIEGMGYAIPISEAIPIINDLMNKEVIPESEQAYLGISGQTVTEAYASRFKMPQGYYVSEIGNGSPAQAGGLSIGDIIVKIDSREINDEFDLKDIITSHRAGEQVQITCMVLQNGEYVEKVIDVTLGSR